MNRIEEALGTIRGKNETWSDVLDRVNRTRGIDVKTLYRVVISILEILDEQKKGYEYPSETAYRGIDIRPEDNPVQSGDRGTEEKI